VDAVFSACYNEKNSLYPFRMCLTLSVFALSWQRLRDGAAQEVEEERRQRERALLLRIRHMNYNQGAIDAE